MALVLTLAVVLDNVTPVNMEVEVLEVVDKVTPVSILVLLVGISGNGDCGS